MWSFASLAQNPHNRACSVEEAQEWRRGRGRGRPGKAFTCCMVTVCRVCSAGFLNLCISPCTKPVTFCLLRPLLPFPTCPVAPPAHPWARHSASPLSHCQLELSCWWSQEQDIKKHGGMIRCVGSSLPGCLLVLNKMLRTLVQLVSQWCPYMTECSGIRPGYHPSHTWNHRIES